MPGVPCTAWLGAHVLLLSCVYLAPCTFLLPFQFCGLLGVQGGLPRGVEGGSSVSFAPGSGPLAGRLGRPGGQCAVEPVAEALSPVCSAACWHPFSSLIPGPEGSAAADTPACCPARCANWHSLLRAPHVSSPRSSTWMSPSQAFQNSRSAILTPPSSGWKNRAFSGCPCFFI